MREAIRLLTGAYFRLVGDGISGEEIARSILNQTGLKNEPARLARFLVEQHDLVVGDAVQIALRLANEPEWAALPAISQLELILTQHCNLKCDYCFVGEQSERMMSEKTGRETIDFLLEASGGTRSVRVTFFGGEPLLALKRIRTIVLYGEKAARAKNKEISWGMTTNGTLLDEESLGFFHDHKVIYLLSIDGDRKTQDAHRRTRKSASSYRMLAGKFSLMKKYQPWLGARITLMPDTVHRLLDNVKFLIEQGIHQFIIEPAEGIHWPPESRQAYIDQMTQVAKLYLARKENTNLRIDSFDKLVNDNSDARYKRGCWAGKSSVAVAPDGRIYPCSKFISPSSQYPAFVLGHVSRGITEHNKRDQMVQFPLRKDCYECSMAFDCFAGCPANNYLATGDQASTSTAECEHAKMRLAMQRVVSEIMHSRC